MLLSNFRTLWSISGFPMFSSTIWCLSKPWIVFRNWPDSGLSRIGIFCITRLDLGSQECVKSLTIKFFELQTIRLKVETNIWNHLTLIWRHSWIYPWVWFQATHVTFMCPMRFNKYPLDEHICKFMVGSSNYDDTR